MLKRGALLRVHVALFTSALVALSASAAPVRGYVLEQEIVTRSRRADGTLREVVQRKTVRLAGDRARLDDEYGEALIVRLGRRLAGGGEVIQLDDLLMSYERKTFRTIRAQWKSVNALLLEQIAETPSTRIGDRADLIDQLTNQEGKWREIWKLPPGPERERLLAKYNLPAEPTEVIVRASEEENGGKKEIIGIECVRYEAAEDGVVTDCAWIAPELPFDTRYYEFMELWGWIRNALADALRKVKGLPLASSQRKRTGVEIELRTRSIEEKTLDTSIFEIPPDYRERKRKSTFR